MSDTVPTNTPLPPLAPISGPPGLFAGAGSAQSAATRDAARRGDAPERSHIGRWISLARPSFLLLGVAPVAATLALLWATGAHLLVAPAVFSLLAVVLVQSGAHLLDEYLEFERFQRAGALAGVLGAGDPGALLASSGIAPLNVLRAGCGMLIAGGVAGIPLIATGGAWVAVLGASGLAAAFLYSSTTYAIKRLPGGEAILFGALGPGIAVTVALAERTHVSGSVLLAGCALGLLALAQAVGMRVSGQERDKRMGRRALTSYLGIGGSRLFFAACLVLAYVLVVLLALQRGAPYGALAVFLSLPAAALALTGMLRARTPAARALLPRWMLRMYTLFALWLVVGLLVGGIVAKIVALAGGGGA